MTLAEKRLELTVREYLDKKYEQIAAYDDAKPTRAVLRLSPEALAQRLYAKLTASQFCRQRPAEQTEFLRILQLAVEKGEPIPCILGHGPLKNRNNSPHPYADWAEFFAYTQLMKLATAIKELYEPGLRVSLYLDDGRAEYANHVPQGIMDCYRESVEDIIAGSGFHRVIEAAVSLKTLYLKQDHSRHLVRAEEIVSAWQADPANREAFETMMEHASRNLLEDPEESEVSRNYRVREATHRYLVCYEAEKLCGIWSRPDTLYMRYSPHQGFYQIFTLRKGSVSQPWQGRGTLLVNSLGKPDPYILTRAKCEKTEPMGEMETGHPVPSLKHLPLLREKTADPNPIPAVATGREPAAVAASAV